MSADEAEEDFIKARNKARLQGLMSALTWRSGSLMPFYEVTSIIKPRSETYLGMKTIPVDRIIGSEGRYYDFSPAFYPKKELLRGRWTSVDRARLDNVILPPVSVYFLGGFYFVRDGNHRVSVARSEGVEFIDAEVVQLDSQIPITPGMTLKELRHAAVAYERKMFLSQYSGLGLPMDGICFNSPGAYPEMVNHIKVHKYYINEKIPEREVSLEEAAKSWFENVYSPIARAIRSEHLLSAFPGQSEGDLYMWLVRRWDDYKREELRDVPVGEAVRKAADERGADKISARVRRTLDFLKGKLAK